MAGVCLQKSLPSGATGTGTSSSSTSSSKSSAAPASLTTTRSVNQAPNITLITTPDSGAVVMLKRGSDYAPCGADATATADKPCELGATAVDPDGGVQSTVPVALDITKQVVVCPPMDCLKYGCSAKELRSHLFSVKGLKGCGIDTLAAEGTHYEIDFWVWDSGSPVLNATVTRTLVLTKPCTSASAPYACSDANGNLSCSGSPCESTAKFLPPASPSLAVALLPNDKPVYVRYGAPAPFYLGACPNLSQQSACGAVAYERLASTAAAGTSAGTSGASNTTEDLSKYIQVLDVTECPVGQVSRLNEQQLGYCFLSAVQYLGMSAFLY